MKPFIYASVVLALTLMLIPLRGQTTDLPKEARSRIDYLVGTWDVYDDVLDDEGDVIETTHSVHITEYFLGESVLVTSVIPDAGAIRKTIRFYDISAEIFYEISVGVEGDLYMLSGGLEEYVMNFKSRQMRDGRYPLGRFIHANIEPDSFEAVMEFSRDDGETWERVNRTQRLVRRTEG
ncbi:MAG: hypothetical protein ABFS45_21795 [Pseudomonadota bacterium]